MIEPRSVVHFSIAVSDLDASQKFYTEILGLPLNASRRLSKTTFAAHDKAAKTQLTMRRGAAWGLGN
jgi:catechol 2,3-dioxygenase-like lactoylglutathione lyase family enzyme